jgi:transposase
MLVELAWFWLRYQPNSKLSHWWHERFGSQGMRGRKVGIVALARKLAIALWRRMALCRRALRSRSGIATN